MASAFGVSWDPINFDIIGDLPKTYAEGQARQREDMLRAQLSGGLPRTKGGDIDWNAAVQLMAKTGNLTTMPQLVQAQALQKQMEEQRALRQLGPIMATIGAGTPGAPGQPQPQPQSPDFETQTFPGT